MDRSPVEHQRARFEQDPDAQGAFEFLEEHWFMQQDWPALAELYRRRLASPSLAAPSRQRAQIALRLGQLLERRLDDGDAAIRAYTDAIRADPALRPALQHLRRLYAARQSWETVLQIAEQEATIAESGAERARLLAEMGDIWRRELGDEAQAELLYERSRAEADPPEPGVAPALLQSAWVSAARGDTETALDALRQALEHDPADVEALDMTLDVLEGAERHEEMPELLERRAALASDPETRAAVLLRLGELHEGRGDLGAAREVYESAREAHPAHAGAFEALRRVHRAGEDWTALRALLEESAATTAGPARAVLLCELALLLAHQFGDPEAARVPLDEAAALAPEAPEVRSVLEQLGVAGAEPDEMPLAGEQRSTRLVGVLERKLAGLEAQGQGRTPEAYRLRQRIGELLAGSLGDPAAAIDVLEPALDDEALLLELAPTLARLYEQLGHLDRLAELAERAGRLAEPASERADWLRRAAETARALGDATRAIRCYRSLLAEHPQDAAARSALADLYRHAGETAPLVELLRAELPRAEGTRELELHLELARIFADTLPDAVAARAHLRRALELEPGRADLLERALELCDGPLARLDLIELLAENARDDTARAALLARQATLLRSELAWEEQALASFRAARTLAPEQPERRAKLESPASR